MRLTIQGAVDYAERRLRAEASLELTDRLLGEARVTRAQHAVTEALSLLEGDDTSAALEFRAEAHLLASETNLYRDLLEVAESHAKAAQAIASSITRERRVYSETEILSLGWAADEDPEIGDELLRTRSALAYWKVCEFQGRLNEARAQFRELAALSVESTTGDSC